MVNSPGFAVAAAVEGIRNMVNWPMVAIMVVVIIACFFGAWATVW